MSKLRAAALGAAADAAVAAAAAAHAAVAAGGQAAAAAAVLAQQQCQAALRVAAAGKALPARRLWLHKGERPCPLLTRLLRRPAEARSVSALRAPSGRLVSDPQALPTVVAGFWAGVGRPWEGLDPAAAQAVLAAVSARAARCPPAAAAALGAPEVTEAAVLAALRRVPSGKAPGRDGLPSEFYRAVKEHLAPLLARVFSAIGASAQAPASFLEGVIVTLFKKGDRADPASYRPITLTNADYRLLAKILVHRLAPVLDDVIPQSQTAFLRKRLIGDNVLLLQLLPTYLQAAGRGGLVAFLDFYKAYDTAHRPFLLKVMEAVGVGPGFLHWASLLMSGTTSFAVVNGFWSPRVGIADGVRQGCPLAPLLYLFIALALLCWLESEGFGVPVRGALLAALQFADDAQVPLTGRGQVQPFLAAMDVFAAATGQRLNRPKVQLLPVGRGGAPAARPAAPTPGPTARRVVLRAALAGRGGGVAAAGGSGAGGGGQPLACGPAAARAPASAWCPRTPRSASRSRRLRRPPRTGPGCWSSPSSASAASPGSASPPLGAALPPRPTASSSSATQRSSAGSRRRRSSSAWPRRRLASSTATRRPAAGSRASRACRAAC